MPRIALALCAAWFLLVGIARASSEDAERQAAAYLQELSASDRFSGVVLVARDGRPVFERAYGHAVLSWRIANTTSTRFEIASLTKQFTGAAILQLAEAGKLSLDDRVSKHYAQAPASWSEITVRQLVHHTSGLPGNGLADFPRGIATPYTMDELIATFRDRPLAHPPGVAWAYTNTEYYLLAYIIEKASGQSYGDYLRDHIFRPAGMEESGYASTLAIVPNAAQGYSRNGAGFRHRDYFDRSLEAGAGGIYTTAGDLLKWNLALESGRLLNPRSHRLMFAPDPLGGYGFGWFIERQPRLRQYHEGSDPGFAAFEARYPNDRLLVIVLANIEDSPVREIEARIANYFLAAQ